MGRSRHKMSQVKSLSICFLCGSRRDHGHQNAGTQKQVGRGRRQQSRTASYTESSSEEFKWKSSHNLLLNLVLGTCQSLYDDLVQLINSRRDEDKGEDQIHFGFCGDCEKICEEIEALQLQLEVIQMKMVDKLQSVKETVIRNSRAYGSNFRVKEDLDRFEIAVKGKEMEGQSCGVERHFLEILGKFQMFVFERDVRQLNIPLVYLEKYTGHQESPARKSKKVEVEKGVDVVKKEPVELGHEGDTDDHIDHHLDSSLCEEIPEENGHSKPEVKLIIDSVSNDSPVVSSTSKQFIKGQKRKTKGGRIARKRKATITDYPNNSTIIRKVIKKEAKVKPIVEPTRTSSRMAASSASQRLKELRSKKQVYQIITKIVLPPKRSKPTEAQLLARQVMQARLETATISNEKMYSKGTKKERYCEICQFKHRRLPIMESHLKTHEIPEEKNFTCPDCNRGFTHKQLFDMHLLQHVGQRKCDVCDALVKSVNMEEHLKTHSETVFRCHWCDYVFGSFPALVFHTKYHKGKSLQCELCPSSEAQALIYSHPKLWRGELLEHLYKVHNFTNLLLKCEEDNCSKTFWDPLMLRVHMNIHAKRYPCLAEGCDKLFVSQGVANFHYQHVHAKEKPHKCDLCSEKFSAKDVLNNHQIAQHGFAKPKCELCHLEFTSRISLFKHKRVVHRLGKNVDRFQCKVCKKMCASSRALKDHLITHSSRKDFTCEICGFGTSTSFLLKCHIKKHDGEKRFQCSHCPKAFTFKRYLDDHLRTHTLERPFQCETCGAAFNQRGSLNLHKKKHLEKGNNFLPKGPRVAKKDEGSTEGGSADGTGDADNINGSCEVTVPMTDAQFQFNEVHN